ncbi:MAG TPA: Imm1 family immunity protein [Roseiarcus sp.]|nr:Imm1 family immunity protein [Roseiarcus sp.]
MIVKFHAMQDPLNQLNAKRFENCDLLIDALRRLQNREPFFCELDGQNGFKLLIGLGNPWSCVQYSKIDGEPPYLMAMAEGEKLRGDDLEFLIGNTVTPVLFRYALSQDTLRRIIRSFFETGEPSRDVRWEEI